MAYTPNSVYIFTAAFAGALAGMGASDRVPKSTTKASYATLVSVAGAFAQSFDTAWASAAVTVLDVEAVEEICESVWQERAPQAALPTLNPDNFTWSSSASDTRFATPATYTSLCNALIAMIQAGEDYFTAQGITPPALVTTSGPVVAVYSGSSYAFGPQVINAGSGYTTVVGTAAFICTGTGEEIQVQASVSFSVSAGPTTFTARLRDTVRNITLAEGTFTNLNAGVTEGTMSFTGVEDAIVAGTNHQIVLQIDPGAGANVTSTGAALTASRVKPS